MRTNVKSGLNAIKQGMITGSSMFACILMLSKALPMLWWQGLVSKFASGPMGSLELLLAVHHGCPLNVPLFLR